MVKRAFTFVEVAVVIIMIGILAAMVIPRFGSVTEDAKAASLQSTLAGVRAGVAAFRTNAILAGTSPFPSADELLKQGVVMQSEIPANPFTNVSGVQEVKSAEASKRVVSNPEKYGWNYYVDNSAKPPAAVFYANTDAVTTVLDSGGKPKSANEL